MLLEQQIVLIIIAFAFLFFGIIYKKDEGKLILPVIAFFLFMILAFGSIAIGKICCTCAPIINYTESYASQTSEITEYHYQNTTEYCHECPIKQSGYSFIIFSALALFSVVIFFIKLVDFDSTGGL